MNLFQTFILNIFELISLIILWSSFNKKRSKLILKNFTIILISSLIILVTNYIDINFSFIIIYIIVIILICSLYKKRLYDVILEFDISMIIILITELFLTSILFIINKNIDFNSFKDGLTVTISLLITSILITYLLPIYKFYKKYIINNFVIRTLAFNLTIWIISFKLLLDYNTNFFIHNVFIFMIFILLFILLSYTLYIQNYKLNKHKKMIELNKEYYPMFDNILHETKRKQHEFKNHLNAIYGLCYSTDKDSLKDEVQKYINFLNYSLKDIDEIINIDNKMLAAVIYSKFCEAENKKIDFSYSIETNTNNFIINEYELVEILSNLLNNAFEAVNDSKEKIVYVKMGKEKEYNFIEVGNTGITIDTKNINKIFKRGFSTKNKNFRGYGLYNIKKILESYDGYVQVSVENRHTLFKAFF